MFANDKTLFNFIAADVSRAQIRDLEKLFKDYLLCVLAEAGIAETDRIKILSEYDRVEFANTSCKSVLGSMNELAFCYRYHILEKGGVHSSAVPGIIISLNHMPMGAIKYSHPMAALKAMYQTAT